MGRGQREPLVARGRIGFQVAPQRYKEFSFMPARFCLAHEMGFNESDDLAVPADCRFHGGIVVSCHQAQTFDEFVWAVLKVAVKKERAARKAKTPAATQDFLQQLKELHPWLTDADFQALRSNRGAGGGRARATTTRDGAPQATADDAESSDNDDSHHSEQELPDIHDEEAPGELALIRADWTEKGEDDMAFYCRILGGKWTLRHKGIVADSVAAFARSGMCKGLFCHNYSWPSQFTCTYAKYGMEASHTLCREFCRRGDYYFSIWAAQPDDAFQFSKEDIESYEETLEWITFLTDADAEGPVFQRGIELRRLVPTNPDPADFE